MTVAFEKAVAPVEEIVGVRPKKERILMLHTIRRFAARITICLFCGVIALSAHPHLFIDVMAKFMLTDSTLSGINVFWDMDEMYSASLINEFDLNRNNRFEKDEFNKMEREAFSFSARSGFFIVFTWGKKLLQTNKAENFVAVIQPGLKVRYSFFIPCALPLMEIAGQDIVVFFNDPSMFIAFDLKKELVQISTNKAWEGGIRFKKDDYIDHIILSIKRKQQ
ncbi:MAG: DUF1007 family protein [Chitinispirillaceae bacterium]|nr:DUF1007 family protein [Chitinispirillaceae bacterium]